jgi:hypothetical protein
MDIRSNGIPAMSWLLLEKPAGRGQNAKISIGPSFWPLRAKGGTLDRSGPRPSAISDAQ